VSRDHGGATAYERRCGHPGTFRRD